MKNFKAGIYVNQGYYKSFQPKELNKQWLLDDMEQYGILKEMTGGKRGQIFMFEPYIRLF